MVNFRVVKVTLRGGHIQNVTGLEVLVEILRSSTFGYLLDGHLGQRTRMVHKVVAAIATATFQWQTEGDSLARGVPETRQSSARVEGHQDAV